jgi:hypothetical protein
MSTTEISMVVELYPHQRKAVDQLHNGAILWGDVGTGKTLTAAVYYMENEAPKDVIVITTAKKRDSLDWESDFARFGVGRAEGSTTAGVLTVDSWNNLGKYRDRTDAFFIFDEQRVVGSGKWTKDFLRVAQHNRWILLSATPGDTWLDYIPVFVANGFYKNRTEFLREHVIYSRWSKFPKVDRYIGVNKLVKYRNQILVHMQYQRHTIRVTKKIPVDYDKDAFDKVLNKRWHIYLDRPLRDVGELFLVMRKVVNSSPTRLEAIRSLISKHPRLIVFYNFDYELEALRSLANTTLKVKQSETTQEHESWEIQKPAGTMLSASSSTRTTPSSGSSVSVATPMPHLMSSKTSHTSTTSTTTSTFQAAEWNGHKHEPNLEIEWTSLSTSPNKSSGESKTYRTELSGSLHTTESRPNASSETASSTTPVNSQRDFESFAVAEWNGHKHEPIPETESWLYLVQYQAGSEGWNCIETDAMAFYSLTYSYKMWHQAHGRIDRLNTPYKILYYYVLMSDSIIDKAIWRALQSKKSFNESRWLKKLQSTHS